MHLICTFCNLVDQSYSTIQVVVQWAQFRLEGKKTEIYILCKEKRYSAVHKWRKIKTARDGSFWSSACSQEKTSRLPMQARVHHRDAPQLQGACKVRSFDSSWASGSEHLCVLASVPITWDAGLETPYMHDCLLPLLEKGPLVPARKAI